MSKYWILNSLKLSPAEKRILIVVEKLKMAGSVARISGLAHTPRTSTIHTLRKLLKWKLVSAVHAGKRTHYKANPLVNAWEKSVKDHKAYMYSEDI